jgi:hypothetical protein
MRVKSGRGDVEGNGGVFGLLVVGSPTVSESLLLLEQGKSLQVNPHERILDSTNHA